MGSTQTIGAPLVCILFPRNLDFPSRLTLGTGAFVAAPVGGLLWALGAFALRIGYHWIMAKVKGHQFDAFDRPPPPPPSFYTGNADGDDGDRYGFTTVEASPSKGKIV